ncbi:peptidase [Zavarzinia compransoris]|uniref:Peptidase n=1 Tax=Zavarzinia compransoris TaxID=1264899 RepID=A0A317E9Y0_9PROT|nr:peptidase [Zavarzinia compransoris]PWR23362.1 peptidase [Zavarzinia compransoris]TDP46064.1 hypothetical protein DES42_104145 [Zavarzinia compransoris]
MSTIDIFRTGRHIAASGEALTFSAADLAATVAAYDPATHDAPLVVGHPASDDPAYGWVAGLAVEGDLLRAVTRDVEPAFAELVNGRRFKHVSASFYRPRSPANPVPGVWYLRHVGFLGAQPPAVKGLRTPSFSAADDDAVVTVAFFEAQREEPRMTTLTAEDLARREAELSAREAALNAAADLHRQRAVALAATENAAFVESLVTGAKLPSGLAGRTRDLLGHLDADTAVEFGEGEARASLTPRAALRELLSSLPAMVEFGERAAAPADGRGQSVAFAAPAGYQVDKANLALHQRALAYQQKHPETDYLTAVQAVSR